MCLDKPSALMKTCVLRCPWLGSKAVAGCTTVWYVAQSRAVKSCQRAVKSCLIHFRIDASDETCVEGFDCTAWNNCLTLQALSLASLGRPSGAGAQNDDDEQKRNLAWVDRTRGAETRHAPRDCQRNQDKSMRIYPGSACPPALNRLRKESRPMQLKKLGLAPRALRSNSASEWTACTC